MLRDAFDVYNRHILKIMILSIVFILPVSFFVLLTISYVFTEVEAEYSNIYAVFLILLNFTILFPPFVKLTVSDRNDEELPSYLELCKTFMNHFGVITLFTLGLFLIALWGSVLLLVPTIVALCLMMVFPLFVDQKRISGLFHEVGQIVREEHILILIDLLILVSISILTWTMITFLLNSFENNFYVYVLARSIINGTIFPLFYIYLTLKYKSGGETRYV